MRLHRCMTSSGQQHIHIMTQPGETLWNLGLVSNAQTLEMSQVYQAQ
jgi:hypothetical protein